MKATDSYSKSTGEGILILSKQIPRDRSKYYLNWVRTKECVVCGDAPSDPHHLIGHGQGGMGLKSSDYLAFPLCRLCHHNLHQVGQRRWEEEFGSQWEHAFRHFYVFKMLLGGSH